MINVFDGKLGNCKIFDLIDEPYTQKHVEKIKSNIHCPNWGFWEK